MKKLIVMIGAFASMAMGAMADTANTVKVTKFHQPFPFSGKATVAYTVGGTLPANAVAEFTISTDDARATFVQSNIVTGANSYVIDFASSFGGALVLTNASFVVTISEGLGGVQLWANGPCWAECNVGASKPEEYGYCFWWGDTVGYKRENNAWVASDGSTSNFSISNSNTPTFDKDNSALQSAGYIDSTGNLVAAHDAATAHLGSPWRMPTSSEIDALISNCTTTWMTTNGVSGLLVTGKGDYADRSIFLPAAGYTFWSALLSPDSLGRYWSSTPYSGNLTDAWGLTFGLNGNTSHYGKSNYGKRHSGWSVRPVRGFAPCDASGTVTCDPAETVGGYTWAYRINGGTAEIYNANYAAISPSPTGAVTIPSTLGGYPVTSIGDYAFDCCSGLTSVTIPDSVTSIGYGAFSGCRSLTNMTLPFVGSRRGNSGSDDSVFGYIFGTSSYAGGESTYQYYSSYYIPTALRSVTITDETVLGYGAFSRCSSLTNVTIGSGVTSIGDRAFYECEDLTGVTIPDSVTSIGGEAFSGCSALTSVTIPNSVTSIGFLAFFDCRGLTDVTIPGSVTNIGHRAFSESSLTNVTIGSGVMSIWDGAFSDCSGLTSVTIPDSVTSIGSSAFSYCSGLTSVTIPDSVTSIAWDAFSYCSGLTSVTIPDSVTSIAWDAFYGCSGLRDVTVPQCVLDRGIRNVFSHDACSSITNVSYSSVITNIGSSYTGYPAFSGCSGLTSVTIPDSVTSIGSRAFEGCSGLTSVHITDLVKWCAISFGSNPLEYAHNLYLNGIKVTDLVIPDGITSIGDYAFSGCSGLSSVTISDSVTSIGYRAFYDCSGLTSVTIGSGVTSIEPYAFDGCSNVREATVPGWGCTMPFDSVTNLVISDGTTSIRDYAFDGCSGLTSLTIPDSVTSIGYRTFYGCSGLTNVTIPDSVTSIGEMAFSGCSGLMSISVGSGNANYKSVNGLLLSKDGKTLVAALGGLTSVTIPDSVTSIGDGVFYGCGGLTSVTIPDSVTNIGDIVFAYCEGLASVTIPDSVTSIGDYAFSGCSGLMSISVGSGNANYNSVNGLLLSKDGKILIQGINGDVVIPDSVTEIGDSAFSGCDGLTSVAIGSGVTEIGDSAFSGCDGLTSVAIGSGVTSIGRYAFSGCDGLTSVTIPNSVTSIEERAFSGCSGLASVTIPNSVTSIGERAFYGCSGLMSFAVASGNTNYMTDSGLLLTYDGEILVAVPGGLTGVTIPDGVTSIGDDAFLGCSGLTSVTIPDSVTSIGWNAFYSCSGIRDVTVPQSVLDRGIRYVFSSVASSITNVSYSSVITNIGSRAFDGCSGLTSVTIPDSVTSIGSRAFYGCSGLTSVTIPDSVTSIGDWAFDGCSGLKEVSFLGDVPTCGSYVYNGSPSVTNYVTSAWTGPIDTWQGKPVKVVADAVATVGGASVSVPGAWMLNHYDVAEVADGDVNGVLLRTAANGRRSVAECYLLGVDPEDPDDDFSITRFWMDGGKPMFEFSHTRDGSGVSFEPRIRKMGKAELGDAWQEVPPGGNPAFRFFKVEVELP